KPESMQNLSLMRQIDELHLKHPYYGVLRMRAALSSPELPLSAKRVRRLMRKMGLEAVYPKPNLSKPCKLHLKYLYLLRDLRIDRIHPPKYIFSLIFSRFNFAEKRR